MNQGVQEMIRTAVAGLVVLLAAIPLLGADAAGAVDEAAELRALLDRFLAGAAREDVTVHDRFWAEDLVYTSASGQRFGKQRILSDLATDPTGVASDEPTPSYSAEAVNVRVYGETAVVTFELLARFAGRADQRYFNTGVFRKRDGDWRAVAWQATRAGSEPEAADAGR